MVEWEVAPVGRKDGGGGGRRRIDRAGENCGPSKKRSCIVGGKWREREGERCLHPVQNCVCT